VCKLGNIFAVDFYLRIWVRVSRFGPTDLARLACWAFSPHEKLTPMGRARNNEKTKNLFGRNWLKPERRIDEGHYHQLME